MYDLAKIWTPQTRLEWPCRTKERDHSILKNDLVSMKEAIHKNKPLSWHLKLVSWWTVCSSWVGLLHQQRELLPQLVFQQCSSPPLLPVAHTSGCLAWSVSLLSWVIVIHFFYIVTSTFNSTCLISLQLC